MNQIEAIISRLCHDITNSLGTVICALEENEKEIALDSAKISLSKIEAIKYVFKESDEQKTRLKLEEYAKICQKNLIIENYENTLSGLIFALLEKMLTSSKLTIKKEQILLEKFFFTNSEISALEEEIESDSHIIFFYLAYLKYKNKYKLTLEKKENNTWIINLKANI